MRIAARSGLLLGMTLLVPQSAIPQSTHVPLPWPAGRYRVDSGATRVHFHVKALIGGYDGDFVMPDGSVSISAENPGRAAIDIAFPVEKLTTGDSATDAMLKGDSFFDNQHFPNIRFVARNAPLVERNMSVQFPGDLTMHGQTHPVTLSIHLVGGTSEKTSHPSALHFSGTTTVERSQFGMGFGRPFVSNRVELTIDALFNQPQADDR